MTGFASATTRTTRHGSTSRSSATSISTSNARSTLSTWKARSPRTERRKIHPLGLNYAVDSPGFDWLKVKRSALYTGRDRVRAVSEGSWRGPRDPGPVASRTTHAPRGQSGHERQSTCAVHDSHLGSRSNRVPGQADTVRSLNVGRAGCVRALRGAFGSAFFGGLVRDEFALRHYPDCVLPSDETSGKRQYLEILREHPICVTSTGLNGSNGWRLGEYVALSKAIVTEPLRVRGARWVSRRRALPGIS